MRCNFVAYFVLGLATVVYTAPVDGLASMASLETRSDVVVFEYIPQPAAEAVPSRFHLPFTSTPIKDKAAEESSQSTVKNFLSKILTFKSELKKGSVFGGTASKAEGRIDFVAKVPGFDGRCQGWATPSGNGELRGAKGGKPVIISVEDGVKQVRES
ncbi:hypothetical protein F5051DRAFT_475855 [Lentinula edodes]|nr:hypothetical protein F5051DRAFT_475855 [Lentinula edodes]